LKTREQPLVSHVTNDLVEAGCDEAGRGCLAGPVYAAAVILPRGFTNDHLTDSKKLTARQRERLRILIEKEAVAWSVASVDASVIDEVNILNASILAMHRAVEGLEVEPAMLLIDGNRFKPYREIRYQCIIKGDGRILSIAAASVLAKTYRDAFMENLHDEYPLYGWKRNKGYPSVAHREAVKAYGFSPYHRKTFRITGQDGIQLRIL
jgi:ribonuclease HII